MKNIFTLCLFSFLCLAFQADKPAYRIYQMNGKKISYEKMLIAIQDADVIFFGELHDNPISHWLQYELTADLYKLKGEGMLLGAEMFESDNQLILDEYAGGLITLEKFEEDARLWKNYKTDYRPLVQFARDHKLAFIATNIPRRYASMVYRKGFESLDSLSGQAKNLIAPLPVEYDAELACYKDMLEMDTGGHGQANENLPKAQAIKDATMAHFILSNHESGKLFLHFNGAYHSENKEGIVWYLRRLQPGLNILNITTVLQNQTDILDEDHLGKADFIIVVPESMTRTY